jgi:hypothetical protein
MGAPAIIGLVVLGSLSVVPPSPGPSARDRTGASRPRDQFSDAKYWQTTVKRGSHTVKVVARVKPFDLEARQFSPGPGGEILLRGVDCWGTEDSLPTTPKKGRTLFHTEFDYLKVFLDGNAIHMRPLAYKTCFDPHLPLAVHLLPGGRVRIGMDGADGAAGYVAEFYYDGRRWRRQAKDPQDDHWYREPHPP